MEIDFYAGVCATTYGAGPFHPAIRNGNQVYYWPNITFATEDEAYRRARQSLDDAIKPMADAVASWNVYPI